MDGLIERLDDVLGEGLEHIVSGHHRRRLRRLGWERAIDAGPGGWAQGGPPPRAGNEIEPLVDGALALPAIEQALEGARSHVHIAGWTVTAGFELHRSGRLRTLRELLAELAERVEVRVLLWAGAPLPLFHPTRSEVRDVRRALVRGSRARCALDARERFLHCHHEKLVVVDDELAFVGGMDMTLLGGDRYDWREHPPRGERGWHDATTRIRGPVVGDVADHFRLRWQEVAGEELPLPQRPAERDGSELQLVRTVPERLYRALPRGDFSILESYTRALRAARRLIYLESQFLWSTHVADLLAEKLTRPPSEEFRLVIVLPSRPFNGGDDTRGQLAQLAQADAGAGRFLACGLYAHDSGDADQRIYVHAKIGIVDDEWLTIGSANLNAHSLLNDSEVNVVSHDPDLARRTRLSLWAEHLELPAERVDGDPHRVVDELWRPAAEEGLARIRSGRPLVRRLAALEHVSRRTDRLRGPIQGLVVDG